MARRLFMSESDNLDVASFKAKVLEEIRMLQSMVEINSGFRRKSFESDAAKQSEGKAAGSFGFNLSMMLGQYTLKNLKAQKRIDERTAQAKAFLKEPETKRLLCPELRAAEDNLSRLEIRATEQDAAEIASVITPLLLPLARRKSISLADEPVAFALSAWIIARTEINVYCAGNTETDPLSL
jgi:hypothetical protein